jgi:hypothetical protein
LNAQKNEHVCEMAAVADRAGDHRSVGQAKCRDYSRSRQEAPRGALDVLGRCPVVALA